MADGWFGSLPYFLDDMRPQGFLGRHFARANAPLLQVPTEPRAWSEDDVLVALSLLGSDQPGCHVLGEPALRRWLAELHEPATVLDEADLQERYESLATSALSGGIHGRSAGGEFPKFTAVRRIDGKAVHVIVKFSGSDASPGTSRWSDLLVCEHLAGVIVQEELGIESSRSAVHKFAGRTFLEVQRFDRHGLRGRSPVCSWFAMNAGLFGLAGRSWIHGAAALRAAGHIDAATQKQIQTVWHFGQLIANTDMHDGNLSFLPGLRLAPVYDMLPMLYAPERGVELPERAFRPALPLPAEREAWNDARRAAEIFWQRAAADKRITAAFRRICRGNAAALSALA